MRERHMRTWHGLPPQPDLELPLLKFVASRGGSIVVSDCRDDIVDDLAEQFELSQWQLEQETNDGKENLWWNWIRHVRRMLVKKRELDGSIRDVWTVTDLGHRRLKRNS